MSCRWFPNPKTRVKTSLRWAGRENNRSDASTLWPARKVSQARVPTGCVRRRSGGDGRSGSAGCRSRCDEPDAIRLAVQSVLASPAFLFLNEPFDPQAGAVRPLSDFELAGRLSYFLWSSMPDDELLSLASQRELAKTETLRREIGRMLRDRWKSRELSESFAVQWLKLDQLYSAKPDRKLFKDFYAGPQGKSTLHGAMLTEPLLLFETVLVEDRSVLDLCDADFTWLNGQLADLYGLQEQLRQTQEAVAELGAPSNDKTTNRNWYRVSLSDRTPAA